MKNDTCPSCQYPIVWHQHAKHTWSNLIVCKGCSKRFNYHKTEFFTACFPVILFSIILYVGRFFVDTMSTGAIVIVCITMVLSCFFSFYLLRRVRLIERK